MAKWISVKERFPEDGRRVLTYGNPYYDGVAAIDVCTYDSKIYQPFWEFVTHYMPLPEPPKEGSHD